MKFSVFIRALGACWACVVAFALSGCFSPMDYNGDSANGAAIRVSLPGAGAGRTTLENKEELSYELLFSGPDGRNERRSARLGETVTVRVVPGRWTVTVTAYNGNAKKAVGEDSLEVRAGSDNSLPVKMAVYTEVSDFGELKTAVEQGSDDDFIVVKSNISNANDTITLDAGKKVTIVAETDVTIRRGSTFQDKMLAIGNGCLVLGSPGYSGTLTLDGGGADVSDVNGPLIYVSGGSLVMERNVTLRNNLMTGFLGSGAGGVYVGSGSSFVMNGGTISGNTASGEYGGGVYVYNGTFTMNEGSINNNTSIYGGGVSIAGSDGTFDMRGGSISGNIISTFSGCGGGVYVYNGTFTMSGGTISDNTLEESWERLITAGGGVYVFNGTFTMSGGIISGNAAENGGGVWFDGTTFAMSGAAQITAENDVYLASGKTITVSGPLTQEVAAKVTPASYIHGMQILTGETHQAGKFDIGENEYLPCRLDNEGLLWKDWYAVIAQGTGASVFNDIAVDAQGNVYAAGGTVGNTAVNYGNGVTYTGPAGVTNAVLVKYDPQGNALWARGIVSGSDSSQFLGIVLDSSGNVFVSGEMYGNNVTYDFGLGSVTTKATNVTGIIVKYAPDGTPLLQKTPESASSSYAMFYGIGLDSEENVYVTGMKYGVVDYGNGAVTGNTDTDTIFLVKYDPTFTAQWVKTPASASGTNGPFGLAVDAGDNIYVVGYHNGSSITFGDLPALGSGYNAIIVKWDSDGNALWAKKASGSQSGFGKVTAYGGAVYATGEQNGTGSYDYGDGVSITGSASKNPVLVKYDASSGAVLWAKTTASDGADGTFGDRVAADESGVFVTGYQKGTNAFDYGNSVTATGASSGNNAVLVKYNADGAAQYAHTVSVGASDSEFKGVAMRGDSLYLVGHQKGTGAYTYVTGSGALAGGSTDINAVVMRYKK
jgi:hypothetical protein